MPQISIVTPARNEAENIAELIRGIAAACAGETVEIIVVDDGSEDATADIVRQMTGEVPHLRLLRHPRAAGQSAAIHSGVRAARAPIVATLDGDGQNPPEELPRLYAPFLGEHGPDLGLVAGQRVGRQDTTSKKLASRAANAIRGALLNDGTRDTGCGLKAFRREGFLGLPYFDHMHRYLPALFVRDGWTVAHVDVSHRPRRGGTSKYNNLQRGLVGAVDLMGVLWLIRRRKRAVPSEAMVPSEAGGRSDTMLRSQTMPVDDLSDRSTGTGG
ncbi:glycosyltransferase family 2 protein [Mesobaculum littorinae]|uniref:Glycosyltransferase family 2 protein n=1 Tax=Mesobaculum littorinae TaxID=2486419 RepID=A0A438AH82_9RHOB|nr:glycosyltransferase family 2 protein [Mesobaculum littorinae]RVV98081.1 glycosyltransferase family 2 protein [Mesobaculum littorinae]